MQALTKSSLTMKLMHELNKPINNPNYTSNLESTVANYFNA